MTEEIAKMIESNDLAKEHGARLPAEAIDEIDRELAVRLRVFARWVNEGRVSKTDARDRLQRMIKASIMLQKLIDLQPEPEV